MSRPAPHPLLPVYGNPNPPPSLEYDFVSRFGVLAYHPGPRAGQKITEADFLEWPLSGRPHIENDAYHGSGMEGNQFAGKLFRRSGKGGHQFVMHYLDTMFSVGENGKPVFVPVKSTEDAAAGRAGAIKKTDLEETSRLWGYRGGRVLED